MRKYPSKCRNIAKYAVECRTVTHPVKRMHTHTHTQSLSGLSFQQANSIWANGSVDSRPIYLFGRRYFGAMRIFAEHFEKYAAISMSIIE